MWHFMWLRAFNADKKSLILFDLHLSSRERVFSCVAKHSVTSWYQTGKSTRGAFHYNMEVKYSEFPLPQSPHFQSESRRSLEKTKTRFQTPWEWKLYITKLISHLICFCAIKKELHVISRVKSHTHRVCCSPAPCFHLKAWKSPLPLRLQEPPPHPAPKNHVNTWQITTNQQRSMPTITPRAKMEFVI